MGTDFVTTIAYKEMCLLQFLSTSKYHESIQFKIIETGKG